MRISIPLIATRRGQSAAASGVRTWILPVVTALLVLANHYLLPIDGGVATAVAASFIVLTGIPHGTLDVDTSLALPLWLACGPVGQRYRLFFFSSCRSFILAQIGARKATAFLL
jgi:hypothetical protein